jgi:hypothetical protein
MWGSRWATRRAVNAVWTISRYAVCCGGSMLIIIWRATGTGRVFSLIIVPPNQEENVSGSLEMAAMSS